MCWEMMWGSQCDYFCFLYCVFCYVLIGKCLECVEGFYGENCEDLCGYCVGGMCIKDIGYCDYGCEDGWFGGSCNL